MADWTNLPDTTFEPGAPAKGRDMRFLRDNPIAIAEGAAGAPKIQTAAIATSAVTQAKMATDSVGRAQLRTATGSFSQSIGGGGSTTLTLDDYSFAPSLQGDRASLEFRPSISTASPSQPRFDIVNTSTGSSRTFTAAWRYIAP